jgi:hypothetical protein
LRAYSRRKLDRAEDLKAVLEIIDPVFGQNGLTFDIELNPEPVAAIPFEVSEATEWRRERGPCVLSCLTFKTFPECSLHEPN